MLLHLLMHRPCFSLLPTSSCFPWLPLHFSHFFASLSVWSVSFCVCLWNSQTKTPIIFIKSLFTDFHLCFVFFFWFCFLQPVLTIWVSVAKLSSRHISLWSCCFCFVLMRSFLLWGWVCGWGLVSCCCSSCDMMLFFFFFFLLLWLMSFSLSLLIIIITIIFSIWWCSTVCLLVDLLLLLFLGLFFEKIPYSLVFVKLLLCKSFGFMFTNPVAGAGLGFVCSFLFGLCEGVFASFWVVCWGCWLVQICDQFFTMVFLKHVVVVDLRVSFMLQPWGAWKWTDNMKHTHHPPRASFLSVHLIWYSRRERKRWGFVLLLPSRDTVV